MAGPAPSLKDRRWPRDPSPAAWAGRGSRSGHTGGVPARPRLAYPCQATAARPGPGGLGSPSSESAGKFRRQRIARVDGQPSGRGCSGACQWGKRSRSWAAAVRSSPSRTTPARAGRAAGSDAVRRPGAARPGRPRWAAETGWGRCGGLVCGGPTRLPCAAAETPGRPGPARQALPAQTGAAADVREGRGSPRAGPRNGQARVRACAAPRVVACPPTPAMGGHGPG
jgi:hypothetical protein